MTEQRSSSLRLSVSKQIALRQSTTLDWFTKDLTITMRVFRLLRNFTLSFQIVMKLFTKLLMSTSSLEWEDKLSNGTTFSSPRSQPTLRFLPKWVISTNKSKMSSKLFTITKRVIDTTQQRLMSSLVSVCTMPNKICSKRLSFTSKEHLKFRRKKWNGNSWLLHATAGWIFLTRHLRFTKRSTTITLTTSIA